MSRSGGTVLRGRLKICWAKAHEGSNPSSGTDVSAVSFAFDTVVLSQVAP